LEKENSSYKQIVKSTSIFGGLQVTIIIIGVIRTKIIAILLGKAGVGLIGMYQNIIDLVRSISSLGIETGGIRDIASSADDKEKQGRTISVFRWWVLLTSCLGTGICVIFSYPISIWAFGDSSYTFPIILLSLAFFFGSISAGQTIVFQGKRMIAIMAKTSLFGNIAGFIISIVFYFLFGIKGIIPAFILGSFFLLFFTNVYYKKLKIDKYEISHSEAFKQGASNLKLGLFVVTASIVNTASMFLIRAFLNNKIDLESVGVFQSVWTITSGYLLLVLKSMTTDYFPRLCSIADNNHQMRRLVNEQTYMVLVIATPIVVAMLLFSKLALFMLYSSAFTSGEALMQWQIIGGFFKALSWPLAYVMLAKGKGPFYLLSELLFFVVYLGASYFLFPTYGLLATGIAYLIAYIVYLAVVFFFGVRLCHFRWNKDNILLGLICSLFIVIAILILIYLPDYLIVAGITLSLITIAYSLFMLNKVFNIRDLINKIKGRIH